MGAEQHRACKVASDLQNAREALVANGIPLIEFTMNEGDSVCLIVRRSVQYDSSERIYLSHAEWMPFADLFKHSPLTLQRLEQGLGRQLTSTHTIAS